MRTGYDQPVEGHSIPLALRRGTNLAVFDLTTAGRGPGNVVIHFTFKVRLYRPAANANPVGEVIEYPSTLPDWASRPVVDSTLSGATVTLAPADAVWRTAIRPDLICNI